MISLSLISCRSARVFLTSAFISDILLFKVSSLTMTVVISAAVCLLSVVWLRLRLVKPTTAATPREALSYTEQDTVPDVAACRLDLLYEVISNARPSSLNAVPEREEECTKE